jgi:glutaredoxin
MSCGFRKKESKDKSSTNRHLLSKQIKQRQEHIGHLLSCNDVKFEVIDVAASQPALQYMKRQNNGGSTRGRAKELPQVFVGGQYRGVSHKQNMKFTFSRVTRN